MRHIIITKILHFFSHYIHFRQMYFLWMTISLIANSLPRCFHTETVKTSLHKDSPPDSYIKQSLSLSLINKTLLETAAYLTTTICSPM